MSTNLKRVIAFLLDLFVISIISYAVSLSPLNPAKEKQLTLQEELQEITEEYKEKMQTIDEDDESALETTLDEYREIAKNYTYDITRSSIYESIINTVFIILYFALFAYYFDGQTVGKRITKLNIVDKEGNRLSLKKMLLRTILLFGIPFTIINLALAYILTKNQFYTVNNVLYWINIVYQLAIVATALGREDGRGLHDLISGSKVEKINTGEVQ